MARRLIKRSPSMGFKGMAKIAREANRNIEQREKEQREPETKEEMTFEKFKKELPDVNDIFAGDDGVVYKAKRDTYSDRIMYFKGGRSNSTKASIKQAYDIYIHDMKKERKGTIIIKESEETLLNGYTAVQIAEKWMVSVDYAYEQLLKGTKIELEHTNDKKTAQKIASQHLYKESIEYYNELEKMEEKLKNKPALSSPEFDHLHVMVDALVEKMAPATKGETWGYTGENNDIPSVTLELAEGNKLIISVNEADSGEIEIGFPDGTLFSGDIDNAVNFVNYWSKHLIASTKEPAKEKTVQNFTFGSDLERVTHIRQLIDEKGDDIMKYSEAELHLLRTYEGMGGQASKIETKSASEIDIGILDQFYTPYSVIEKMWGLAMKYGFSFTGVKRILEPSCGIGRFFEYVPEGHKVIGYEIDKYAYTIAKLTFPKFNVLNQPFETHFWDTKRDIKKGVNPEFDLVIGNPPYRPLDSAYVLKADVVGKTEKQYTGAHSFDQYVLMRGIDLLVSGGLLIFIIPNSFLANDHSYNLFKESLIKKAELIDAYRLPNGVFGNTGIGTDIVVFRKKAGVSTIKLRKGGMLAPFETEKQYRDWMNNNVTFYTDNKTGLVKITELGEACADHFKVSTDTGQSDEETTIFEIASEFYNE
jgi:hypothetical protein